MNARTDLPFPLLPMGTVHLVGAGIDRRTGVSYRGVVTWKVKLRAGTLQFRSDPARLTLRGAVIVAA